MLDFQTMQWCFLVFFFFMVEKAQDNSTWYVVLPRASLLSPVSSDLLSTYELLLANNLVGILLTIKQTYYSYYLTSTGSV